MLSEVLASMVTQQVNTSKDSKSKDKQNKQKKSGLSPPIEQKDNATKTEDILNSILPPREWTDNGQLWVQVRVLGLPAGNDNAPLILKHALCLCVVVRFKHHSKSPRRDQPAGKAGPAAAAAPGS
jgi:hypothetical protein